jgi:hypothetical protein
MPTDMYPVILGSNANADVLPDGTFTIPMVPDVPYSVLVTGLSGDTYIADILQNGRSVFDTGTLLFSAPDTNLEVVLNSPAAVVAGRISAPSPSPSTTSVVLVPLERNANTRLYRRITPSGSGEFSIGGVVPGRYRLFAFENLPNAAEFDRSLMESFRERGTEITAAGGRTTTAELSLIRTRTGNR